MHMSILRKGHPREADPTRYSFRTQSVRHNKSQPFGNKADGACHQPSAQPDLCDSGCTRSMGSWHAIQRFTQAIEPMKDIISYEHIPAKTKFTFAKRKTARVNWTLHLRYHTTPPCSTNIDVLEQGTVPILLSISQVRNLYMTIEHTPQCDKITRKAFGMNRQAVPVSDTGHALVDLAGVARVKAHGAIAHKGLINYVYDDDNSIKFPSGDLTRSETVCAAKSSETKEDLATPKIIGSQKQDHWILDKKNKQPVCTSRPERRCSHQMEPRNVQSILITSAENVPLKSLMHPQVEIQTFWKRIGDLHPRQRNR